MLKCLELNYCPDVESASRSTLRMNHYLSCVCFLVFFYFIETIDSKLKNKVLIDT